MAAQATLSIMGGEFNALKKILAVLVPRATGREAWLRCVRSLHPVPHYNGVGLLREILLAGMSIWCRQLDIAQRGVLKARICFVRLSE